MLEKGNRIFSLVAIIGFMLSVSCTPVHNNETNVGASSLGAESIEIFSRTLQPIVTQNCASCHGVSQSPLFAESDSLSSHNVLINRGLISMNDPSQSQIVNKIRDGHNGIAISVADDMEMAIEDWLNEIPSDESDL